MAKTVTLKDHKDNTTVYPQTLTKCIQDEEGKTLDYLVLMKNNTTEFTPTGDYQPATKKYVDENSGGSAVRYDAAQTLTDEQQTQARENISAQKKLYNLELDTPIVENVTIGADSVYTFSSVITLNEGDLYWADIQYGSPLENLQNQMLSKVKQPSKENYQVIWNNKIVLSYNLAGNEASIKNNNTDASIIISIAKVINYVPNGDQLAMSEGMYNVANGLNAHAEGSNTTASGVASHSEGSNTTALGNHSHVEGEYTNTQAPGSHAEGSGTYAWGYGSHAEGQSYESVSANISQTASDEAILADWIQHNYTMASGDASHAEGIGCLSLGSASHAEGMQTAAIGVGSHAEGFSVQAKGEFQHAQGKNNIIDDVTYAHIVGNGTSSARSNAHTLDWSGNAWFAGDVYTGSTSGTNKDDGSKKLATEAFVNDKIHISTADPTASDGKDGDIWLKYEA